MPPPVPATPLLRQSLSEEAPAVDCAGFALSSSARATVGATVSRTTIPLYTCGTYRTADWWRRLDGHAAELSVCGRHMLPTRLKNAPRWS